MCRKVTVFSALFLRILIILQNEAANEDTCPSQTVLSGMPESMAAEEEHEETYTRKDGMTDFILKKAQTQYADMSITKEDIFYYVYGWVPALPRLQNNLFSRPEKDVGPCSSGRKKGGGQGVLSGRKRTRRASYPL